MDTAWPGLSHHGHAHASHSHQDDGEAIDTADLAEQVPRSVSPSPLRSSSTLAHSHRLGTASPSLSVASLRVDLTLPLRSRGATPESPAIASRMQSTGKRVRACRRRW